MDHPFARERLALAQVATELDKWMPEEEALALEVDLARALQEDTAAALTQAMRRVLASPAKDRLRALLALDMEQQLRLRGYHPTPGHPDPVSISWYVCPRGCHLSRPRFFAADPIPQCPEHHIPLVPKEEASC